MPKYEPGHFNQNQYIQDFVKEKYDRVVLQIPKGSKDTLKALAKQNKCSVNALIINALEKQHGIILKPKG